MRCVLGLFEGVATGAADGYARMAEKPACTLLHLGPGLANGLANLHNARRARVPIITSSDNMPRLICLTIRRLPPTSKGSHGRIPNGCGPRRQREVGRDSRRDRRRAHAPGQIATLIVPADVAWGEGGTVATIPDSSGSHAIDRRQSSSGRHAALRLANSDFDWRECIVGNGLTAAGRIATATGAKLLAPYPLTRLQRGAGIPTVDRVAYVLEQGIEQFKEFRQLILVGRSLRSPTSPISEKDRIHLAGV